jgi:hypothetical protein
VARTFLQLVNDVLVRLRETTVVTNNSTAYSTLIGAFVNDAKREVEDAWQWSGLLDYFTFTVQTAGVYQYETTGATTQTGRTLGDRTRLWIDDDENVPLLFCTTKNYESQLMWQPAIENFVPYQVALNQGATAQNIPVAWQVVPSITNNNAGLWNKTINIYYPPNQIAVTNSLTYRCYVVNPQVELANDSDVMIVPYWPVVQKAYLYALFERGEELGESLSLTAKKVEDTLSNAISLDQQVTKGDMKIGIPYGGSY